MSDRVALTRRWYEEGWMQRRPDVFRELAPEQFEDVTLATGPIDDMRQFLEFYEALTGALPDLEIDIERIEETEDGTVTSWRFRGTHTGKGFGCSATGKRVESAGTTWQTIRDGRIVGGVDHWDFGRFFATLSEDSDG